MGMIQRLSKEKTECSPEDLCRKIRKGDKEVKKLKDLFNTSFKALIPKYGALFNHISGDCQTKWRYKIGFTCPYCPKKQKGSKSVKKSLKELSEAEKNSEEKKDS